MAEKLKLGGHTTVDIDDLSGDEPRLARHQEQNQVRNIFRVARSGYDLHQTGTLLLFDVTLVTALAIICYANVKIES
jgi:hypothetical protein